MTKIGSPTLHIVFGNSAAANLQSALARLGRQDRAVSFNDNLAEGPIDPPDLEIRARWSEAELGYALPDERTDDLETFWSTVLSDDIRRVVWVSRRSAYEYAGFLQFVWRAGDLQCEVVDLTDLVVAGRKANCEPFSPRLAGSLTLLSADEIVENDLPSSARPLSADMRDSCRRTWQGLKADNAPLRILNSNLELVSAPISFFDQRLLSFVQHEWKKTAFIIGKLMSTFGDDELSLVGDTFLATRLRALADAGLIEVVGDIQQIRYSEVRLPSR